VVFNGLKESALWRAEEALVKVSDERCLGGHCVGVVGNVWCGVVCR
jgi:hypothetical protein